MRFLTRRVKIENLKIRNPDVADKKLTQAKPGQKILTQTHR